MMPRGLAICAGIALSLGFYACGRSTLHADGDDFAAGASGSEVTGPGSATNASSSGAGGTSTASSGSGAGGGSSSSANGGASASSSSSAAGGTGGGGNGGAGGCGSLKENCLNGVDDNCDGLVDCADPLCNAGFTCAPAVAPGWQGPLAVYTGNGANPAPFCGGSGGYLSLDADGFDGLAFSDATCPGCSCSDPKGVSCAAATASFFDNKTCNGQGGTLPIVANTCEGFVDTIDPGSVQWSTAPASGGVCIAKAMSMPVIPPVSWATRARACGGSALGAGCGNAVCAPKPQGSFGMALCVAQNGDLACPNGYSKRHVYYQGTNDTRACSDCECGAPTGMTCTGKLELWDYLFCGANLTSVNTVGQCGQLAKDSSPPPPGDTFKCSRSIKFTPGGPKGGSCTSTASKPIGTVETSQPLTICCTQ